MSRAGHWSFVSSPRQVGACVRKEGRGSERAVEREEWSATKRPTPASAQPSTAPARVARVWSARARRPRGCHLRPFLAHTHSVSPMPSPRAGSDPRPPPPHHTNTTTMLRLYGLPPLLPDPRHERGSAGVAQPPTRSRRLPAPPRSRRRRRRRRRRRLTGFLLPASERRPP